MKQALPRLWPLTKRYWFDALLVVGLGVSIAGAVIDVHKGTKDDPGPQGPLWFDVILTFAMFLPLFWRRRYPFGAPAVSAIAIGASSFVDGRLVPHVFFPFLLGIAVAFLFGSLPERRQAVAGLAILLGVCAILHRNDPTAGPVGDLIWISMVFSIAWAIGLGLGGKLREADEAKERAERADLERADQARLAVADERARIA